MAPPEPKVWAFLIGISAATPLAHADPASSVASCVETHETGLDAQRAGKLTAAYTKFAECTAPICPGPVREECAAKVKELDERIPTVVPAAKIQGGAEALDVRVEVDSRPLTSTLDGRAHRMDPGPHTFR